MLFSKLNVEDAYIIDLEKKSDERGFFARSYCRDEFLKEGLNTEWVQINNSLSKQKGTLRGLHFQYPPYTEVKLVRCIKGVIWDVIVDIRKDSETYGEWVAAELSQDNRSMMYVPKGCAHGFISLTSDTEIIYMVSSKYAPDYEGTLKWDDQFHNIEWPIIPEVISEKDQKTSEWDLNQSIVLKK